YEQGREIVMDLCSFDDATIIDELYLAKLRGKVDRTAVTGFSVRRYRLDLDAGKVAGQRFGTGLDLPRVNEGLNTSPYRYVYGTSFTDPATAGFFDQLTKLDVDSGEA